MPYLVAMASQAVICRCHLESTCSALLPSVPAGSGGGGGGGAGGGGGVGSGRSGLGGGGVEDLWRLVILESANLPLDAADLVRALLAPGALLSRLLDFLPEIRALSVEMIPFFAVGADPCADLARCIVE